MTSHSGRGGGDDTMSDARIIPADALDFDAATIVVTEQRWEDNELLDTQEMADLFEACHRLRAHIAAQEAVIQGHTALLREVVTEERWCENPDGAWSTCVFCDGAMREYGNRQHDAIVKQYGASFFGHTEDCWTVRVHAALASPDTQKGAQGGTGSD